MSSCWSKGWLYTHYIKRCYIHILYRDLHCCYFIIFIFIYILTAIILRWVVFHVCHAEACWIWHACLFSLCRVDSLTLNVLGRLLTDKYYCILIWFILNRGYTEHYLFRSWFAVIEENKVSDCQSMWKPSEWNHNFSRYSSIKGIKC